MTVPAARTPEGAAGLAAIIAEPARAVVALDFDGTLAPIVDRPADARPAPGAIDALTRISDVVGALAIVTGRPAGTLIDLAGFATLTGAADGGGPLGRLVVLGHYGLERWDARSGRVTRPPLPAGVAEARAALPDVLAQAAAPDGTSVEDKEASLAVHVRGTADPAAALEALRSPLTALADRTGLVLEPGRMVLELRPPGVDKGSAIASLVDERQARSLLVAGDDLGDLAAFDAVESLRGRGIPGVTVCAGSAEVTELRRRADIVVDGPVGVVRLLDSLASVVGTGG